MRLFSRRTAVAAVLLVAGCGDDSTPADIAGDAGSDGDGEVEAEAAGDMVDVPEGEVAADDAGDVGPLPGTCAAPIALAGSGSYAVGTAGLPATEAGSCGGSTGPEAVFLVTLAGTSDLHVDTEGSSIDTVLYVRSGGCAGAELACNDELRGGVGWSRLELRALPAGDYAIVVDAVAGGGTVVLHVAAAPPLPAPRPLSEEPLARMPGTQRDDGVTIDPPVGCTTCHSGYDPALEPATTWRGSMMAQASRDPLFWATLTVAAQDAVWATGSPNAVDICLRCHFPGGWLENRSEPANASAFVGDDFDGVHCDVCHRMVDPFFADTFDGTREGDDWAGYWDEQTALSADGAAATRVADRDALSALRLYDGEPLYAGERPAQTGWTENAAGQYFVAGGDVRGPFADAVAPHAFLYSRYHRSRNFCGTCHDVSNPVLANLDFAGTPPGDGSTVLPTERLPAYSYSHVERTFSEFLLSAFGQPGGAAGSGDFDPSVFRTSLEGNLIARCQDCHMADASGRASSLVSAVDRPAGSTEHPRSGMPRHELTGGNAWVLRLLASIGPGSPNYDATNDALLRAGPAVLTLDLEAGLGLDSAALLAGAERAEAMLASAADLEALAYDPATGALSFRIRNHSGHKLPSGFTEGRRIFVNVRVLAAGSVLRELNPYDDEAGTLRGLPGVPVSPPLGAGETFDDDLVLEALPQSSLTGEAHSFHFVLGTGRSKDNRIPPRGFRRDEAVARLAQPVREGATALDLFTAAEYSGGWDDVVLAVPAGADRVEVRLFYQTTTREYVEFLRDEVNGEGSSLAVPTPAGAAVAYIAAGDPFFDGLRAWGDTIWSLWDHNRGLPGAAPILMSEAIWTP